MHKQRIQYATSLDALIAVTKRLSLYESQHQMDSEEFFDRYTKGQLTDDLFFIEWANDYQNFLGLRQDVEKRLQDIA